MAESDMAESDVNQNPKVLPPGEAETLRGEAGKAFPRWIRGVSSNIAFGMRTQDEPSDPISFGVRSQGKQSEPTEAELDVASFSIVEVTTEADFEETEADLSPIFTELDNSNVAQAEIQAVVSELRQSTETALSELAEAVAAL